MNFKKNKSRIISIALAFAVVLAAFAVVKVLPKEDASKSSPVNESSGTLVEVIYPEVGSVEHSFKATGKLRAFDRFEIFAQVDGQLLPSARFFKEGNRYQKGEVMLEIDRREYEMTLQAQKSDFITLITSILPDLKSDYPVSYPVWRGYVSSLDVTQALPVIPAPANEQEKFYLAGKGVLSRYYNILSAEEKMAKYTIKAPFNGVVTATKVESGTAVRMGTAMGTLINTQLYDLEITVPLAVLDNVKVGTNACLTFTELQGEWEGEVVRVGGDLDAHTQSVKLFIRTSGRSLKEGMFLTAELEQQPFNNAMSLPRKMVDDQNRVFIVENGQLERQAVNVLFRQGDIAVISGLQPGTAVLSTVVKSAYEGMPVRIANN
jgi:multidrug efflux pump subunit AcrA (membrane-fusion protein)